MRIQSRIYLSIAASLIVSVVLAFFAFWVVRGIGDDLARGRYYNKVIHKTFALNLLVATFDQESGPRALQQLGEVRASLTMLLDNLSSSDVREESLIRQIQRNNRELGPLLDQFFAPRSEQNNDLRAERKDMLATQLYTKAHFISDDTSRLLEISESRIVSAHAKAGITVLSFLITLIAANVIISLISGRSIVRMQVDLQKQREWLQVTLSSIGDAVIATDTHSKISFLNPVAAALTGWPMEEALGRPVQDLFRIINEKTRAPAEDIVRRALREGANIALANHTALVALDGREIPIEDSAAPIKDSAGKIAGVVLVFHDVTEKRRATESLRESEERYRSLFNSMTEGFALHEIITEADGKPSNYRFLEINPAFERLTGLSRGTVVGKTVREVIPDVETYWIETYGRVALDGNPAHLEKYSAPLNRWYEVFAYRTAPRQFAVFLTDINDRKEAEATLTKAHERTRRVLDSIAEGYYALDAQWRFVEMNPVAERHFKGSAAELVGKDIWQLSGMPRPESLIYLKFQEAVASGQPLQFEAESRIRPGNWSALYLYPLQDGLEVYFHDITDRKRAEEALQNALAQLQDHARRLEETNRELERFAYTISHDLRAPLRAINGFAHLLADDYGPSLEEEGKRRLAVIEANAIKMGLLIDDLLAFSRAGRTEMNVTGIDMNRLVADVVETVKTSRAGVKAGIHVGALPAARGDPALIRQVLANLLENAVKFSRNRPGPRIEVGSFERDGKQVYFVKDNGVGFDMKYYNKLFGVFQRLVTEKEFEGTGVGLAIVQRLVVRHGGRVWAEGKPGEGATFFFTLNRKDRVHAGRGGTRP